MSFDTSWDVEKYKTEHETDEHWEFKKTFLSTHKNKYPEHRLVSLAQVFFNVEFLGCIYPTKTMELIESLTEGLADDLKKNRKRKIQRTFVAASDAAEAKVKRTSVGLDSAKAKEHHEVLTHNTNNDQSSIKSNELLRTYDLYGPDYILPGFLLLVGKNEDAHEILDRSCGFCNIPRPVVLFDHSQPNAIEAKLFIKNKYITSGLGSTEKIARKNSTIATYNILKENCFSIKIKTNEETLKKEDILIKDQPSTKNSKLIISTTDNTDNESQLKLNNNNIGSKMLKTMGWKEGVGLGKNEQGRLDPIEVVQLPKKLGLGNTKPATDTDKKVLFNLKNEVTRHLKAFLKSPKKRLTFSTDFTKDERKVIHMICLKCGLKTKSHGQNENRYMIISKKQSALEVFEELVQNGFENDDYLLIPPPQTN